MSEFTEANAVLTAAMDADEHAKLAYMFAPNSYTYDAMLSARDTMRRVVEYFEAEEHRRVFEGAAA